MQLDKTRIAIRERSFPDILDLALLVIRRHALPLAVTFTAGAAPLAMLNAWLLNDTLAGADFLYGAWFNLPWEFLFLNALLIAWFSPLAAAASTLYLGQALFEERPAAGRIFKELLGSLPQLIWYQVVLRGMLTFFVITIPVVYFWWPYLSEILLLERNPWRKKTPQGTSTAKRANDVHGRNMGELFSRWLAATSIGLGMIILIWAAIWYVKAFLTYHWEFSRETYSVDLQVAIWLIVGYFTVVRYLSYLDLRIRTEGWEVELAMRAEGARLTRQLA